MIGNTQAKYMPKMIQQYVSQNPRTRVNVIAPLDVEEFKQRLADIAFISGVIPLPDCVLLSRGKMVFMPVASKEYLEKTVLSKLFKTWNITIFSPAFIRPAMLFQSTMY